MSKSQKIQASRLAELENEFDTLLRVCLAKCAEAGGPPMRSFIAHEWGTETLDKIMSSPQPTELALTKRHRFGSELLRSK